MIRITMSSHVFMLLLLLLGVASTALSSDLSPYYYDKICPKALPAIRRVVQAAVQKERRMGASLLRLHFHDCFVQGCDGSILLDPTATIDSEKNAGPNQNSVRGFEVIDQIKAQVDRVCGGKAVVSCADILAVAARDSVVALGGPSWTVQLGRRDSTTASRALANTDIPSPFSDLPSLTKSFSKQGLNARDLVALSGGHTIGFAQCFTFKERIFNATNIDRAFAVKRQATCPRSTSSSDSNLGPLDQTPARFDTGYFRDLVKKRGLLQSDQALFSGGSGTTDALVRTYSHNSDAFWADFARSMIKMGNISPLTGKQGQVRANCRRVN